MGKWDTYLNDLESALKKEANAGEINPLYLAYSRLVLVLIGDQGILELTRRIASDFEKRGLFVNSGWLEGKVFGLLTDFIKFAIERSEGDTLVITTKSNATREVSDDKG